MGLTDMFKADAYKCQITSLQSEVESLNCELKKSKQLISNQNSEITNLKSELELQRKITNEIVPLFQPEIFIAHQSFDTLQQRWAKWDISIHSFFEQLLRQDRATAAILTPIKLDASLGYGVFVGKEHNYNTSLLQCECTDFKRRALPCKHMYRLAYELDIYMIEDVEIMEHIENLLKMPDIIKLLQSLSNSQCELLQDTFNSLTPINITNNLTVKSLLKNGLIQISDDKYCYLNGFSKDFLINYLPAEYSKSATKKKIVNDILTNMPNIIQDLEKATIAIEPNRYIKHLIYPIRNYLYRK